MEGLRRLMQGRTVIMVAHHLSTLEAADQILVLKNGIIAEEGTHQKLMELNGIYAGLHRVQSSRVLEAAQ